VSILGKEYNKIINKELEELGLKTRITSVPEEFRMTPQDIIELNSQISGDIEVNEHIRSQSYVEASKCPLM